MNQSKTNRAGIWKVATFLPLLALLLMAFGRQNENVVDIKEVANQVNNENNEIQSLQKGISQEQLLEYENIVNKLRNHKGVPDIRKITDTDRNRLEELFLSMNAEQRKSQIVVFNPRTPPLPKSAPTLEQMKNWEDPKIYGVWINDKRVSNLDLENYANSDFAMVFVSKLAKNAINYGKHYYQVDLMTTEYYANYLKKHELTSKYWIMVRKKNEITNPLGGNNKDKSNFELVHADKFVKNNKNPSIMYFYHAQVKLNEGMLNADYIEVNKDSSLIYATGRPDSTGTIVGKPVLTLGNQTITGNEIRYNYKTNNYMTGKGIIYNSNSSKEF